MAGYTWHREEGFTSGSSFALASPFYHPELMAVNEIDHAHRPDSKCTWAIGNRSFGALHSCVNYHDSQQNWKTIHKHLLTKGLRYHPWEGCQNDLQNAE